MRTSAATAPGARARRRVAGFFELTKPRIAFLVVLTTLVGFLVGAPRPLPVLLLLHALVGTALAAGAAGALNQWAERKADAEMRRTMRRPLPSGRLTPREAAVFGLSLTAAGTAYLAFTVNTLASALAALTVASYLLLYTPLKRVTSLATIVGAVPGALPPMIGWAAARGRLGLEAWVLFGILFLWQMPHFLALAQLYRADYARAGFRMLTVDDATGGSAGRQSLLYALALVPVSLLPTLLGIAGPVYFLGALACGIGFLLSAVGMAVEPTSAAAARRLFRASLLYLPAICILLLVG
ncbi:MAG: protoheme IX farnesyltransferase [Gemmatimonadetes bacterium]|nr:protoheme IX farnesyltransferase [Gemmatimonadota bacterium]